MPRLEQKSPIKDYHSHQKKLEKEGIKHKVSRINTRGKINEIGNKIMKPKADSFRRSIIWINL
jgi:hypothetical protein